MHDHSIDSRTPSHLLGSLRGTVHHQVQYHYWKKYGVLRQYQSTQKFNTAILGSSLHESYKLQPRNKAQNRNDAKKNLERTEAFISLVKKTMIISEQSYREGFFLI
jgi:hypothetical protein